MVIKEMIKSVSAITLGRNLGLKDGSEKTAKFKCRLHPKALPT